MRFIISKTDKTPLNLPTLTKYERGLADGCALANRASEYNKNNKTTAVNSGYHDASNLRKDRLLVSETSEQLIQNHESTMSHTSASYIFCSLSTNVKCLWVFANFGCKRTVWENSVICFLHVMSARISVIWSAFCSQEQFLFSTTSKTWVLRSKIFETT
jgi:hypothetical protein